MTMTSAGHYYSCSAAATAGISSPVSTPALASASVSTCTFARLSLCALIHTSLCVPSPATSTPTSAPASPLFQPKLTVLGNYQGKPRRQHIQKMNDGPCPKIETSRRAKIRARGKLQRISGRRERGKLVEQSSVPTNTYCRRHIQKMETAGRIKLISRQIEFN